MSTNESPALAHILSGIVFMQIPLGVLMLIASVLHCKAIIRFGYYYYDSTVLGKVVTVGYAGYAALWTLWWTFIAFKTFKKSFGWNTWMHAKTVTKFFIFMNICMTFLVSGIARQVWKYVNSHSTSFRLWGHLYVAAVATGLIFASAFLHLITVHKTLVLSESVLQSGTTSDDYTAPPSYDDQGAPSKLSGTW